MATEIIDLDELLGSPKKVKLGGTVYTLPAQIPVPFYLSMKQKQQARQESDDEQDIVEALYTECLELFQVHQPNLKELPIGIGQVIEAIGRIYNPEAFETDPNPKAKTSKTPAQAGRKTTTPRKRKA